jgi:hypothetical protein
VLLLTLALGIRCGPLSTADVRNEPPKIISSPVTAIAEDDLYRYDVQAADPDADDQLTFSLDEAPVGMTIDATKEGIEWTPSNSQVGDNPVVVRVQDRGGLSDTQSFGVKVENVNDPPKITSTAATTALESQAYSYDVAASDPDVGDVLTFSLDESPAGMTINPTTGAIRWTPKGSQVGTCRVTVGVRDGGGLSGTQSFSITVANVNDPPLITSTAMTTAVEDQAYGYDVKASDPDVGDVLTFALVTSPSGMGINATTGVIKWTPNGSQVGTHTVAVRVQDLAGLYDARTFTVTVVSAVKKYAVIVGISDYRIISDLYDCDDDANSWYTYLSSKGYQCWVYGDSTSRYLGYAGKASEYNVRNAIANMAALADNNDCIALVFSGHGGGDAYGSSFTYMWDYGAGENGKDGAYGDTELAADFQDCVAAQLFVFFDACFSGGMRDVVSSPHIGHVYLTSTCTQNGFGWDYAPDRQHCAWTYFFLKWGLEGSGHGSWDMAACYDQAYSEYQAFYASYIEGGSRDGHDWNGPQSYDHPEEFDSHPGTQFYL